MHTGYQILCEVTSARSNSVLESARKDHGRSDSTNRTERPVACTNNEALS